MQNGPAIGVRVASSGDKADIFALLKDCAKEIPVALDGDEAEGRFGDIIECCCQNGASFVAMADERFVGFLLTNSSGFRSGERKIEYGGVASDYRCRGIFPRMLDKAKAISVRLDAVVNDANKCGMADRLIKVGFRELSRTLDNGRAFRWRAGA
jgi:hypothetical protein